MGGITIVGTPGYAPFEQMTEEAVAPGPASDLYSLGVTCFELMSGIVPYPLMLQEGYRWVENWRQRVQRPVSAELQGVMDGLLKMRSEERFQTADAVLAALNAQASLAAYRQHLADYEQEYRKMAAAHWPLSSYLLDQLGRMRANWGLKPEDVEQVERSVQMITAVNYKQSGSEAEKAKEAKGKNTESSTSLIVSPQDIYAEENFRSRQSNSEKDREFTSGWREFNERERKSKQLFMTISRPKQFRGSATKVSIYLNGNHILEVINGQEYSLPVLPGEFRLQLRTIFHHLSNPITGRFTSGQYKFICGVDSSNRFCLSQLENGRLYKTVYPRPRLFVLFMFLLTRALGITSLCFSSVLLFVIIIHLSDGRYLELESERQALYGAALGLMTTVIIGPIFLVLSRKIGQ
ncbi:serine/threonine-protein kinase [Lyngbya confervoides]|uniref:serine/threonine-protein kinase n=1 Tax=Lyngbya confervoides TaxID=207921 RepID=UPI0032D58579